MNYLINCNIDEFVAWIRSTDSIFCRNQFDKQVEALVVGEKCDLTGMEFSPVSRMDAIKETVREWQESFKSVQESLKPQEQNLLENLKKIMPYLS